VGTPGDDGDSNQLADAGAVHFFRYSNAWTVGQTLRAAEGGVEDGFGSALALDREVLAVGAPCEDSGTAGVGGSGAGNSHTDAGAVYLFSEVPSVWTQTALVKATNPGQGDLFGTSVSLDGDLLLVGAPIERSAAQGINGNENDNSLYAAGAAYLYARVDGVWQAQNYIKSTNPDPSDLFGNAVALSGSTLVVATRKEDGAGTGLTADPSDNNAPDSGAVFVLEMQ